MTYNELISLTVYIAVAGTLLLIATGGYLILVDVRKRVKTPATAQIIDALLPLANQAVYGAEAFALKQERALQIKLQGVDKKALADGFYALLPDTITVLGRSVPTTLVKALISKEQWSALVQRAFDEADARMTRNETWLAKQIPVSADELKTFDTRPLTTVVG